MCQTCSGSWPPPTATDPSAVSISVVSALPGGEHGGVPLSCFKGRSRISLSSPRVSQRSRDINSILRPPGASHVGGESEVPDPTVTPLQSPRWELAWPDPPGLAPPGPAEGAENGGAHSQAGCFRNTRSEREQSRESLESKAAAVHIEQDMMRSFPRTSVSTDAIASFTADISQTRLERKST